MIELMAIGLCASLIVSGIVFFLMALAEERND